MSENLKKKSGEAMTGTTLEDSITHLNVLDEYRDQAKKMLHDTRANVKRLDQLTGWDSSGDRIEFALIARAQKRFEIQDGVVNRLLETTLLEDLPARSRKLNKTSTGGGKNDPHSGGLLPTLTAARVMQALVATSKYAFHSVTLQCYYRIVRELYSASGPDWSIGGARAGSAGRATAFVTGECVRAISAFEDSLLRTATFFTESHKLREAWNNLQRLCHRLPYWEEQESERLALAWSAKTDVRLGGIALNLEPKREMKKGAASSYIRDEIKKLEKGLEQHLYASLSQFEHAKKNVESLRRRERRNSRSNSNLSHFNMQETGHLIGQSVIDKAILRAQKALDFCNLPSSSKHTVDLEGLGGLFRDVATEVRKILGPAKRFLATVLDHELAAASAGGARLIDIPELAFSAASLGATTDWQDERLGRACRLLEESISEQGEFPVGRPIQSTSDGFRIDPVGFEVIRACAQVWENTERPANEQFFSRMLRSFHMLSVLKNHKAERHPQVEGWTFEHFRPASRPTKWATALAVLSLRQYTRMLDAVINRIVLRHFDHTIAKPGDIGLETMMHSDVGMGLRIPPRQSTHILLEQLRSHIIRSVIPKSYREEIFSVVFHGPPGTGKTTLLSALATSCGVPLINISPSDFVVRGQEGVERRARAICGALSLLSRSVIILDEFEPIIQDRIQISNDCQNQDNGNIMRTSLTPSMLPKLTRLYKRAKKQRLVYGLVTNHYHKLDSAAIRQERFDKHIVILRPDPISRAGYLLSHLSARDGFTCLSDKQWCRVEQILKWTSRCSVQLLARSFLKTKEVADFILQGEAFKKKVMGMQRSLDEDKKNADCDLERRRENSSITAAEVELDKWENEICKPEGSLTVWMETMSRVEGIVKVESRTEE